MYGCDQFRMFEFKVRRCMRGRSHDWTECPFAHPGEKARRRDPRRFHYSGTACPDFRKGSCRRGDACEYAHGVFECWLHPARYRTQPCKDGRNCRRRVCFFAHTPEQLRLLPAAAQAATAAARSSSGGLCVPSQMSSPTSTLVGHAHSPPPLSPPLSPSGSPPHSPSSPHGCWPSFNKSMLELIATLQQLELRGGGGSNTPPSSSSTAQWLQQQYSSGPSPLRRCSLSVPGTPTKLQWEQAPAAPAKGRWEVDENEEGEPTVQRVESGRDLRATIYGRLGKDRPLE
ncbi:unnamed protein product, partial [Sphagnum compactum]